MHWNELTQEETIQEIINRSAQKHQLIFKHSTRCSISSMAKNRLERSEAPSSVDFYCLDLIKFRSISNQIEEIFKVKHESPQVLLIRNGECIYEESHNGISMDEIEEQSTKAA
jgi:bacillithiol system protein YtxJ